MKRCIVRTIYYRGSETKAYVGCPHNFASEPELFRKHFPLAKVVFCVRDPVAAFPSWVDVIAAASKSNFNEHFE